MKNLYKIILVLCIFWSATIKATEIEYRLDEKFAQEMDTKTQ